MNFKDCVLAYGDNINFLSSYPSESVDLVYLDPPFNTRRQFNMTMGAVAQAKAFEDTWTWGRDDEDALRMFAKKYSDLGRFLLTLGGVMSKDGLYAYIVFMARRLAELHRVLKPTGSLYLHVDDTACHYLKMVLDQIFGSSCYQNQITWLRAHPKNGQLKQFGRCNDTILFYSKGKKWTFNQQFTELADSYVQRFYRLDDGDGRLYKKDNLNAPDDPNGRRPKFSYTALNGITYEPPAKGWRCTEETMRKLDEAGKLAYPTSPRGRLMQKRYLSESKGTPVTNTWTDIKWLSAHAKENTGYDTQKPLALLERIILTGSNEGDVVMDPFMGSGTTCVAAAKLDRQFVGIDVTPIAVATAKNRLDKVGVNTDLIQEWGSPKDVESARHLYRQNKADFDAWAVGRCHALPQDLDDRRIGINVFHRFVRGKAKTDRALFVTSIDEPPSVDDIKRIQRLLTSLKAAMGILICFDLPTDPAVIAAVEAAGHIALNDERKGYPKISLITVQDVIDQNNMALEVFNQERVKRQSLDIQGGLFDEQA